MFRMKADGGYTMTTGAILFYTGVAMVAGVMVFLFQSCHYVFYLLFGAHGIGKGDESASIVLEQSS